MSSNEKIVRLPEAKRQVGLSRSQIYLLVRRGEFPAPVRLGPRAVGWLQSELDIWIQEKADERDGRPN